MDGDLDTIVRGRPLDVPGVAIGLTIDGEAHVVTDGVTDVDHPSRVDGSTLFQTGSVTKTFTATAALTLVDRGVLPLDGLIAPLLDRVDFGEAAATLTLRHLLTHRGGWQGDWALFNAPRFARSGRARGAGGDDTAACPGTTRRAGRSAMTTSGTACWVRSSKPRPANPSMMR